MKPNKLAISLFGSALTVSLSTLTTTAQTTWTGAVSQDWSNAGNWTNGVPLDASDNGAAIINTAVGNELDPRIASSTNDQRRAHGQRDNDSHYTEQAHTQPTSP